MQEWASAIEHVQNVVGEHPGEGRRHTKPWMIPPTTHNSATVYKYSTLSHRASTPEARGLTIA